MSDWVCIFWWPFEPSQESQEWSHLLWSLGPPQYHQLDHASDVSFHGHGPPQGFHGFMVGLAQKRFPIHSNQLVIHSQSAILGQRENSTRQESLVMTGSWWEEKFKYGEERVTMEAVLELVGQSQIQTIVICVKGVIFRSLRAERIVELNKYQ